MAAVAVCMGCASEEARYRMLSRFFDGVPPPVSEVAVDVDAESPEIEEAPEPKGSIHGPYTRDGCERCHDKANAFALRVEKTKLCLTCHDPEEFKGPVVHGPVAVGQCLSCHHHHLSKFPHLLLSEGSDICNRCHTEEMLKGIEKHPTEDAKDCLTCHEAHVSEKPFLLK